MERCFRGCFGGYVSGYVIGEYVVLNLVQLGCRASTEAVLLAAEPHVHRHLRFIEY